MATKKFTDFPLQVPIQNNDLLVGYKADGSTEIRTPVSVLLSRVNLTELANTSGSWNSTYTTVNSNSASWGTGGGGANLTEVAIASARWNNTFTVVNPNSANWNNSYTTLRTNSGRYDSVYTTVNTNSAQWAVDTSTDFGVRALTGDWTNTTDTVRANSAQWAVDTSTDFGVRSLTGRYDSTYTTVNANSAQWAVDTSTDFGVRALTSRYDSAYTTVNTNSGDWMNVETVVMNNSASWNHGNRYLPLSGGSLSGLLSATSLFVTSLTAISAIITTTTLLSADSLTVTSLSSRNTISAPGINVPRVQMSIGSNFGLANTSNSTDSIIQWNQIDFITDTTYLSATTANRNILIRQPGYYQVEVRYASFDLLNAQNFLRVQLRGSASGAINTGSGGNLIGTVDQGYTGTAVNGEAMKSGVVSISAVTAPFWIVATMLHTGAVGGVGLNQGYPVFNNLLGTQPYILVERKSDLPL